MSNPPTEAAAATPKKKPSGRPPGSKSAKGKKPGNPKQEKAGSTNVTATAVEENGTSVKASHRATSSDVDVLQLQESLEAREARVRAVRTKVASALIGTALVDVTQGNLRIEANKWNKRPVDPSGVRQLKRDVSVDGVDVTKDRMIFAVDRKDVVNIEKLPHLYNGLGPRPPMLDLATSGGRLYLIQGGHRRSVATDLTAEYQKDLREAQARNASESALEQYKERISRVQYWPCDLYDYELLIGPFDDPKKQDDTAAAYLAMNANETRIEEKPQEAMALFLQSVEREATKEHGTYLLTARQVAPFKSSSMSQRNVSVLKGSDWVFTFAARLFCLSRSFQHYVCNPAWIEKNLTSVFGRVLATLADDGLNKISRIFSADPFPSAAEVDQAFSSYDAYREKCDERKASMDKIIAEIGLHRPEDPDQAKLWATRRIQWYEENPEPDKEPSDRWEKLEKEFLPIGHHREVLERVDKEALEKVLSQSFRAAFRVNDLHDDAVFGAADPDWHTDENSPMYRFYSSLSAGLEALFSDPTHQEYLSPVEGRLRYWLYRCSEEPEECAFIGLPCSAQIAQLVRVFNPVRHALVKVFQLLEPAIVVEKFTHRSGQGKAGQRWLDFSNGVFEYIRRHVVHGTPFKYQEKADKAEADGEGADEETKKKRAEEKKTKAKEEKQKAEERWRLQCDEVAEDGFLQFSQILLDMRYPALMFMESKILEFRGPDINAHTSKVSFDKSFDAYDFSNPYDDFYRAMGWGPHGPFSSPGDDDDGDEPTTALNQHDRSRRWFLRWLKGFVQSNTPFSAKDEEDHPGTSYARGTSYAFRLNNNDVKEQVGRRGVLYHADSVRYEITAPPLYAIPYIHENVREKVRFFHRALLAAYTGSEPPANAPFWDERVLRRHPATPSFIQAHEPTDPELEYASLRDTLRLKAEMVQDMDEAAALEAHTLRSPLAFDVRQASERDDLLSGEEKKRKVPVDSSGRSSVVGWARKMSVEVVVQAAGTSRALQLNSARMRLNEVGQGNTLGPKSIALRPVQSRLARVAEAAQPLQVALNSPLAFENHAQDIAGRRHDLRILEEEGGRRISLREEIAELKSMAASAHIQEEPSKLGAVSRRLAALQQFEDAYQAEGPQRDYEARWESVLSGIEADEERRDDGSLPAQEVSRPQDENTSTVLSSEPVSRGDEAQRPLARRRRPPSSEATLSESGGSDAELGLAEEDVAERMSASGSDDDDVSGATDQDGSEKSAEASEAEEPTNGPGAQGSDDDGFEDVGHNGFEDDVGHEGLYCAEANGGTGGNGPYLRSLQVPPTHPQERADTNEVGVRRKSRDRGLDLAEEEAMVVDDDELSDPTPTKAVRIQQSSLKTELEATAVDVLQRKRRQVSFDVPPEETTAPKRRRTVEPSESLRDNSESSRSSSFLEPVLKDRSKPRMIAEVVLSTRNPFSRRGEPSTKKTSPPDARKALRRQVTATGNDEGVGPEAPSKLQTEEDARPRQPYPTDFSSGEQLTDDMLATDGERASASLAPSDERGSAQGRRSCGPHIDLAQVVGQHSKRRKRSSLAEPSASVFQKTTLSAPKISTGLRPAWQPSGPGWLDPSSAAKTRLKQEMLDTEALKRPQAAEASERSASAQMSSTPLASTRARSLAGVPPPHERSKAGPETSKAKGVERLTRKGEAPRAESGTQKPARVKAVAALSFLSTPSF